MKIYANGMKSSNIKKSDLAPLYKKAKAGDVQVEKWFMSKMYDLAGFYGYDDNCTMQRFENRIERILSAKDELQTVINEMTELTLQEYTLKYQSKFDRSFVK